ncbi:MAG: hypothetical protein BWY11_01520 [Firmicutes bacterium ADurb.Bin182]|nr:MAG: hypothetical protein BWY11_01520 [Firmicutes bacterium ADurb.Bin182]
MQKVSPHTIPPKPGERYAAVRKSSSKILDPSPALQLAQRIRYEQGTEQLRRYLTAIEPFIAPAERAAIAKQMGIQIVKAQQSPPQSQNQYFQPEEAGGSGQINENRQSQQPDTANNSGRMNQQMQIIQLLAQLAGGGMPGLGNLSNAFNSSGGGMNPMLLAQLLNSLNKK